LLKTPGNAPVLQVEDDENDVFFLRYAFAQAGIENPLVTARDGLEAMHLLKHAVHSPPSQGVLLPCLMLLDLKMPIVNGFEVLAWIRQQPALRDVLPVIVLTSSLDPDDRQKALELGAREFQVKPKDFNDLVTLIRGLKERWLDPANQRLDVPSSSMASDRERQR
jgi:CheY-like chemotaxis protein